MSASTVASAARAALVWSTSDEAPFSIRRPATPRPLVFASPHSGRLYPKDMMAASALDADAIRRSEDALVDELIEAATDHGATVIAASYARAYIDVNREPYELDASMFEDELPDFARGRSARVAAGLGSIARIVAEGQEIYARKLTFAEASERIETVHRPYHAALEQLLSEATEDFGVGVLVDWHSMPAAAARTLGQSGDIAGAGACDLVLGDRFGAACAPQITSLVQAEFESMGYRVARNAPYAGGYTTMLYGAARKGLFGIQIEINRGLYLDEERVQRKAGFEPLKKRLTDVLAKFTSIDPALLGGCSLPLAAE
jgi:N-formylglutamate amidohydrolase